MHSHAEHGNEGEVWCLAFTPVEGWDTVGGIPNQVGNDREIQVC